MEVVPLSTPAEVGAVAADAIEALVRTRTDAVLGLATGSSPLPAYQELIRRHRDGSAPSYDGVRCFTLDEYVGLPFGHPESYRETIFRELTDGLGIARDRVAGPDASDPEHAGPRYDDALRAAGLE
jgi:glucosamine-6-phosphate deaminase